MTFPVLDRLEARLRSMQRRRRRAVVARAAIEAFCLQAFLLPACGLWAALHPYDAGGLLAALLTWAVYLWVPLRLFRVSLRGGRGARAGSSTRAFALESIAQEADRLQPEAPDVFRTVLSRPHHAPATLAALDAYYAPWEARLRDLPEPVFTRGRVWALAAAVAFLLSPLLSPAGPGIPGGAGAVYSRMFLPLRAWNRLPAPRLIPVGLPEVVTRGDSLVVRLETRNIPAARTVYIHRLTASGETRFEMTRGDSGRSARFVIEAVDADFSLRFSAGGSTTREHRVRVVDPPRLAALSVLVTPPAYTGLAAERVPGMPALLSVLPGTRLEWRARPVAPLASLSALFNAEKNGTTILPGNPVRAPGLDHPEFAFQLRVLRAGELRLRLTDPRGVQAAEGPYRVELKADAPPEIRLLTPASDQDLGRAFKLPVLFHATDDFGIGKVVLHYAVKRDGESAAAQEGHLDVTSWRSARDGMGGGVWDVSGIPGLRLETGDAVELWLEAVDNDAVSGPKSTLTPRVKLRVPSREEVRAAMAAGERDAEVSLTSALEREKRLRRDAERPDKGASGDAGSQMPPATVSEFEVRRVLSDQPRAHARALQQELDAEIKSAESRLQSAPAPHERREAEKALRELRALKQEAAAQEKRLPSPEIGTAPAEKQTKALEALNADQRALQKALEQAPKPQANPSASPSANRANSDRAEQRRQVEESLRQNLKEQADMKSWLAERQRTGATEQKRADQAARTAGQMQQDMQRALDQINQAMQKGLENGTLSPDVLEKMDRIRELLEEVLDSDEKKSLQDAQQQGGAEAGDVQKAMQNLLGKKEGLRQNLESAIRMLETLRETRALRDAAAEMRQMAEDEREVAKDLEKAGSKDASAAEAQAQKQELADRQESLNRQMEEAKKSLDALSKNASTKDALSDQDRQNTRDAQNNMQKASDKLKSPSPDKAGARKAAEQASKQLKQVAASLEKQVAERDQAANKAEVRAVLEEAIDFTGWLEEAGDPSGATARAWGGPEAVRQAAVRIAQWLRGRFEKLADANPFEGDVLRREAAALGASADALSVAAAGSSRPALEVVRAHAQRAARELFKMLDANPSDDGDSGGDQSGDGGDGDTDAGGGNAGSSGKQGLSGRLKGASGKQAAVNRATQDLLRSFLEGRQPGGSSSGSSPGAGQPGGSMSGSSGMPSGGGGSNGSGGGSNSGSESSGQQGEGQGGQGAGAPGTRGLANSQQQIGESLEQMAEASGDAGGAARTLRRLADEARELEDALRRHRLDPGEIQRRQERFQTRLLEAANALEERGQDRERRAEAYKGGATSNSDQGPTSAQQQKARQQEALLRELKRRRDEARELPLSPEEKRRVEWYYEQLLAP